MNDRLTPLIEKGYREHCNEIKELIQFRLSSNLLEYYELLVKNRPDDLNKYFKRNAIDPLCIDNELKSKTALGIIENDINTKISEKKICYCSPQQKSLIEKRVKKKQLL